MANDETEAIVLEAVRSHVGLLKMLEQQDRNTMGNGQPYANKRRLLEDWLATR